MSWRGTYDSTIHHNPVDKYSVVVLKTSDQNIPQQFRHSRRYPDHLIRFTAVGYEIPLTDAVELELDGEWVDSRHGFQLQVEQWHEIVPRTIEGVRGYLSSGLIKGIGPKIPAVLYPQFRCAITIKAILTVSFTSFTTVEFLYVFFNIGIEFVKVDIGKYWTDDRALRSAGIGRIEFPVF